jgi:hypothetical protein
MLPKIGPVRVRRLLEAFGEPSKVLAAPKDRLLRVDGIGDETAGILHSWQDHADPAAEIREAGQRGIAIVTQDQSALRAAPRESAAQQAVLWQGDSLEIRGQKGDYLQVYDHRRERAGYVRATQVRSQSLAPEAAPELLSVLRFLRDIPGSEALGISYAAAYLHAAPAAAIDGGRSIDTSMGLTPLSGLVMGTRSGDLDPGVLLFMFDEFGLGVRDIERLIYHESGLLGMSGLSSDMRDLLASEAPAARLAVDVFCYRARRELGSLVAALGGLDAVVFTAGIGENQAEVRRRIGRDAAWLGLELDDVANARHGPCISTSGSRVAAWVVPTDEELMIARHVARLLG